MNNWNIIKEKCPKLYKHGIVFECALGWYQIIYDLSIKIEKILEENAFTCHVPEGEEKEDYEMYAIQVKEKFGTLRFYMTTSTVEIDYLIGDAEAASCRTCEACGEPGKMRGVRWLEVKCDKCYKGKI